MRNETNDPAYQNPTRQQLSDYCRFLKLDESSKDQWWLAFCGFIEPLDGDWDMCTSPEGKQFYFNRVTGESSLIHPTDRKYLDLAAAMRDSPVRRTIIDYLRSGDISSRVLRNPYLEWARKFVKPAGAQRVVPAKTHESGVSSTQTAKLLDSMAREHTNQPEEYIETDSSPLSSPQNTQGLHTSDLRESFPPPGPASQSPQAAECSETHTCTEPNPQSVPSGDVIPPPSRGGVMDSPSTSGGDSMLIVSPVSLPPSRVIPQPEIGTDSAYIGSTLSVGHLEQTGMDSQAHQPVGDTHMSGAGDGSCIPASGSDRELQKRLDDIQRVVMAQAQATADITKSVADLGALVRGIRVESQTETSTNGAPTAKELQGLLTRQRELTDCIQRLESAIEARVDRSVQQQTADTAALTAGFSQVIGEVNALRDEVARSTVQLERTTAEPHSELRLESLNSAIAELRATQMDIIRDIQHVQESVREERRAAPREPDLRSEVGRLIAEHTESTAMRISELQTQLSALGAAVGDSTNRLESQIDYFASVARNSAPVTEQRDSVAHLSQQFYAVEERVAGLEQTLRESVQPGHNADVLARVTDASQQIELLSHNVGRIHNQFSQLQSAVDAVQTRAEQIPSEVGKLCMDAVFESEQQMTRVLNARFDSIGESLGRMESSTCLASGAAQNARSLSPDVLDGISDQERREMTAQLEDVMDRIEQLSVAIDERDTQLMVQQAAAEAQLTEIQQENLARTMTAVTHTERLGELCLELQSMIASTESVFQRISQSQCGSPCVAQTECMEPQDEAHDSVIPDIPSALAETSIALCAPSTDASMADAAYLQALPPDVPDVALLSPIPNKPPLAEPLLATADEENAPAVVTATSDSTLEPTHISFPPLDAIAPAPSGCQSELAVLQSIKKDICGMLASIRALVRMQRNESLFSMSDSTISLLDLGSALGTITNEIAGLHQQIQDVERGATSRVATSTARPAVLGAEAVPQERVSPEVLHARPTLMYPESPVSVARVDNTAPAEQPPSPAELPLVPDPPVLLEPVAVDPVHEISVTRVEEPCSSHSAPGYDTDLHVSDIVESRHASDVRTRELQAQMRTVLEQQSVALDEYKARLREKYEHIQRLNQRFKECMDMLKDASLPLQRRLELRRKANAIQDKIRQRSAEFKSRSATYRRLMAEYAASCASQSLVH